MDPTWIVSIFVCAFETFYNIAGVVPDHISDEWFETHRIGH